jgi:hypothetical protein
MALQFCFGEAKKLGLRADGHNRRLCERTAKDLIEQHAQFLMQH